MENQEKKSLRKLIATLKLHQELIGSMDSISCYLKANNTANIQLMEEALNSIAAIEQLTAELRNEADQSDAWDCWGAYDI